MAVQKVLLVDDSPDIHRLITLWLGSEPIELYMATDGAQCLAASHQVIPDLILLDVDMPGQNGFEVYASLKSSPSTTGIPVIFLTGATTVDEKLKGLAMGAVDYITKPFDPAELRARVRSALKTKQLMDTLHANAAAMESYAAIVRSSNDAIIAQDLETRITSWNLAAERIFGFTEDEMLGCSSDILAPPERKGEIRQIIQRVVDGEAINRFETIRKRKDGQLIQASVTVSPIRDSSGNLSGFSKIVCDITPRKRAEDLEYERKNLKASITAMEQVLGVVGHELRTPLTALRATSEFLLTDGAMLTEEAPGFLNSIHDEVIHMSETVNNLLEAARLNSGKATWRWSDFIVHEACREAMESNRPVVDAGVTLTGTIDPPDAQMRGDANAVCRLVMNLISNSRKHTTTGRIDVRARLDDADASERWIEIQVQDTGSGIAPAIAERLGEAFALNSGVVGSNYVNGTGLGLPICKGIVEAHGGTLAIQSKVGAGTTVTVRLRADLEKPATGSVRISFVGGGRPEPNAIAA